MRAFVDALLCFAKKRKKQRRVFLDHADRKMEGRSKFGAPAALQLLSPPFIRLHPRSPTRDADLNAIRAAFIKMQLMTEREGKEKEKRQKCERVFFSFRVSPRFSFSLPTTAAGVRPPSLVRGTSLSLSAMSPPAMLPVNGASQQHAPANGIHEPQEDYWREASTTSSASASTIPPSPTHADLLFPPCFITLAGLACWHAPQASSPWAFFSAPVLLALFIPCYVLGVFFFVVKLGKFAPPQVRLPASRLIAASAASLLSASFFSFVAWQLPLIWNDDASQRKSFLPLLRQRLRLECVTLVACFSLFLVLQYSLAVADPGRVVKTPRKEEEEEEEGEGSRRVPNHHAGSCATCTTLRPLRSKHCRTCGACVTLFDHHCPVVANCVGSRTLSRFLLFLKVTATGQFLMLRLACVAAFIAFDGKITQEGGSSSPPPPPPPLHSVLAAASTRARGQLLLCIVQVPIFLSTLLLVARGAFCAAANLTVNELANRERYAYLRHCEGNDGQGEEAASFVYCNRFDRGVARNLADFFGLGDHTISASSPFRFSRSSSPHEGDHYWSVRLDEALAEHGPGGLQPPPLGTRVVRWLDAKRRTRRRRRRHKENRNKAGGGEKVSGDGAAGATSTPSVDVELAPLWGGGGGAGTTTTTL